MSEICSDANRAIGAHRQTSTQLLLGFDGPDRHEQDLRERARFLEAQRRLNRDLVERIDAHLEPFRRHAGAVGFHAHADVVVHDALDTDHDCVQGRSPAGAKSSSNFSIAP